MTGAMALLMNACLQVESTISLKKDGSGTITENLILGQQMVQMMEMAAAQAGPDADPMAQMVDKAKAAARAKGMGEGVELVSVEKINANGKIGVKTVFKFADINKLKYTTSSAMGDMEGMDVKEDENAAPEFKYADGKLTIIQKQPKGDAEAAEDKEDAMGDEMEEQAMAMMQQMMKDMRMTMKLKLEPGIKKTNATHVEGDTVTMADIQFDKLLSNPEKLKALQSGDFEKTKKALEGMEGVKFEAQEKVEIELK